MPLPGPTERARVLSETDHARPSAVGALECGACQEKPHISVHNHRKGKILSGVGSLDPWLHGDVIFMGFDTHTILEIAYRFSATCFPSVD